jgi:hypothetical protein
MNPERIEPTSSRLEQMSERLADIDRLVQVATGEELERLLREKGKIMAEVRRGRQ